MALTLTTFFGSTLHGLRVVWSTPANTNAGTTELTMTFTSFNRARMYIYTDANSSAYDTTVNRVIDYSASAPSAGSTYDVDFYTMQYFVAWKNPDTSSSLTYDGVQGRVAYKLLNDSGTFKAQAYWDDVATDPPLYDMKPQTAHNSADTERDTTSFDISFDSTTLNDDHCQETWWFTAGDLACVEFTGILKRNRNTGDTTEDIILEYGAYDMHAKIGDTGDGLGSGAVTNDDDTMESIKLAEQSVDFTDLVGSGAQTAFTVISAASLAAIVSSLAF